ncbi:pirin family protein [Archangium violaceum]|uniref:pirin family protein n=1 Tax=Archangium violaceum TaxID=83451 RepID=UPI0036D7D351
MYVLSGQSERRDSMGTLGVLRAGKLQRMTAGTGVLHSEMNRSTEELHLAEPGLALVLLWLEERIFRVGLRQGSEDAFERRNQARERGRELPVAEALYWLAEECADLWPRVESERRPGADELAAWRQEVMRRTGALRHLRAAGAMTLGGGRTWLKDRDLEELLLGAFSRVERDFSARYPEHFREDEARLVTRLLEDLWHEFESIRSDLSILLSQGQPVSLELDFQYRRAREPVAGEPAPENARPAGSVCSWCRPRCGPSAGWCRRGWCEG